MHIPVVAALPCLIYKLTCKLYSAFNTVLDKCNGMLSNMQHSSNLLLCRLSTEHNLLKEYYSALLFASSYMLGADYLLCGTFSSCDQA